VPVYLIKKYKNETAEDYDTKIIEKINELNGEWVLLCGFMRILTTKFIRTFHDNKLNKSKIINIHPSLLPKYKGAHGFKDSYDSGDSVCGVTLHFVNEELDAGEIFMQSTFERFVDDSFENFIKKGKEIEWSLYPKFLDWLEAN